MEDFSLVSRGIKKTAMRKIIDKVIFASNASNTESQTEACLELCNASNCLQDRIKQWL